MAVYSGIRIDNVLAGDQARVHIGDNHFHLHHHTRIQTQVDTYDTLLASLTFRRMGDRVRNVATALPETCVWLLHHQCFLKWIDDSQIHDHHGFLWIKGKPGSGKSTIMKETLMWAEYTWSEQIVLSYFFNARSPEVLERSSLGLYRSLLWQLLRKVPSSRDLFVETFASKLSGNEVYDWSQIELKTFWIKIVRTLPSLSITIFVDAVDEGTDDDMRDMVKFLESLAHSSRSTVCSLRICLSIRHYPHISMKKSLILVVEDQKEHDKDIELYIRSELMEGDSSKTDGLRQKIQAQSAGVFLWVVLVIPMLNKVFDQGKGTITMLQKLEGLPPGLQNMLTQIFLKDSEDFDEFTVLLQWVLFARRPLSLLELYHAVQYTCCQINSDRLSLVTIDEATRYILNCSRGLVELTRTKEPLVQFIHETVRDYLVSNHSTGWKNSNVDFFMQDFQAEVSHGKLAKVCLHYLLRSHDKPSSGKETQHSFPLASYAAECWWRHVLAVRGAISKDILDLAAELCSNKDKLLKWVKYYNVDQQWRRGNKHYNPLLTRDRLSPPLYYAAMIGFPDLVNVLIQQGANVCARGGYHGSALRAALYCGHDQVVQILFDHVADSGTDWTDYSMALQAAISRGHKNLVQTLIDRCTNVDILKAKHSSPPLFEPHEKDAQTHTIQTKNINLENDCYGKTLIAASHKGYEKVVQMLLEHSDNVKTQPDNFASALQAASYYGNCEIVLILLKHVSDVNKAGSQYGTALRAASIKGREKVIRILLDGKADVNARGICNNPALYDESQDTALFTACRHGHEKVVQMLVDAGADTSSRCGKRGIPALIAASECGYDKVVQILVDVGAKIDAQGKDCDTAIIAASRNGHEKVVQILIGADANMEAQGRDQDTALKVACKGGYEKVVRKLIFAGADIRAGAGKKDDNVLTVASEAGNEEIIRMLLDTDVGHGYLKGDHDNALYIASRKGHERVVEMLIIAGADVNARSKWKNNTALTAAFRNGNERIVQMLINSGAKIDFQDSSYKDMLSKVSRSGHDDILQTLLNAVAGEGIEMGIEYGNALTLASLSGHKKTVRILIDAGADVNAEKRIEYIDALFTLSIENDEEIIQMLVDVGADINFQGGQEIITPLQAASRSGRVRVSNLLGWEKVVLLNELDDCNKLLADAN